MTEPDGSADDALAALNQFTQVDEDGHLFIAPVIHDWAEVERRNIDTVIDLEGGLDLGVPTEPEQILYVYFHIYDDNLPNLDKAGRARRSRRGSGPNGASRAGSLRHGVQPIGPGGQTHPPQAGHAGASSGGAAAGAPPRRALQRELRQLSHRAPNATRLTN